MDYVDAGQAIKEGKDVAMNVDLCALIDGVKHSFRLATDIPFNSRRRFQLVYLDYDYHVIKEE